MPIFAYQAVNAAAADVRGTVVADSPRQARDSLRHRGLTVHEIARVRPPQARRWWQAATAGRHGARVVAFVRELSTLLAVGIPLTEALDSVASQFRGSFRSSLHLLRDRVGEGRSLADAMKEQPAVFDELTVSMVRVGEDAGTLEAVLDQLAGFKERSMGLRSRTGSALIYPGLVLVTGVIVTVFLMTFVVPKLLGTLEQAGKPLPLATTIVKGASDAFLQWWWLLAAGAAGAVASVLAALRTRAGRYLWHRWQLRIPIVGALVRKQATVRIALIVATLMRSGMVFLRALDIAADATKNLVVRDALAQCGEAVRSGKDIGRALDSTGAFARPVIQIFTVGQQSGRLEEMLDRLAADYDRQVAASVQRLTTALEPILILALAIIVGFIAFATILPILEAGNVL